MKFKPLYWTFIFLIVLGVLSGHKSECNDFTDQPVTRAVLFGVSTYADTLFAPIAHAKSDVEQLAAFLRTRSGGFVPVDLIKINTGPNATMAQFLSELNWAQEESLPNDRVVIYLACKARMVEKENVKIPYIFFHDAPFIPAGAGGLPLSEFIKTIQELQAVYSISYQLYLNLKIEKTGEEDLWQDWMYAFKRSFKTADFNIKSSFKKEINVTTSAYLNSMINGLMGDADFNNDKNIYPAELIKYLNKKTKQLLKDDIFFLAFSSDNTLVSTANKKLNNKTKKGSYPIIVGQEISNLEDSLLKKESEKVQQWYNDYIINIKLGRLMFPKGSCASDLYDSLSTMASLQPLHREWQRKLGVALLDETQQVLNAYLKNNTRELFRREENAAHYEQYPAYMEKAIELMGKRTFMQRTLKTKLHYFEGLKYRLQSERQKNSSALENAMSAQEEALSYEPGASYVLNELGVVHDLLGTGEAEKYYFNALEYSPTWCIPHLNLSIHFREKEKTEKAFYHAFEALKLCPDNVIVIIQLGILYINDNNLLEAEKTFRHAIALNYKYELAYYNLSCVKALQGNQPAALHWLEGAIKYGFNDWALIENDPDLSDIVLLDEFMELKNKYGYK